MRNSVSALTLLVLFAAGSAVAQSTAIVGGTVHTVSPAGTIEDATIVIEGGIVTAVGAGVAVPAGATIIDAAAKIVTPGLFTPYGNLGLVEVGFSAGPMDAVQRGERFTAAFDIADAYNPRSTLIAINRIEGVTRALIAPLAVQPGEDGTTSHVISGLAAVANLGDPPNGVDRRGVAVVVNLGEGGSDLAGESRAGALLVLRNALDEALDYAINRVAFERGQHRDYAYSVADLEALQPVLNGTTPLLVSADRASDIEVIVRLVDEYGIRAIILGGAEAWLVADRLADADVPVLLAPTQNLPSNFDRINARRDAAALLVQAGVRISFVGPNSETHNARNITQAAGNAVSEGLPWDDALRAITLAPAEIYGLADWIGSIEPGKEADIVIWPDDPLELTSYPDRVLIKGEPVSMSSRQTLLRDRYLQTESGRPPAFRGRPAENR